METSSHRCCELSDYFYVATPSMSFSYWYTLPTPHVGGTGRVAKSVVVVATFWLALAKVGCGIPSWLMVAAHSVPSAALRR
jgi:hypothetical protein